jgi:hypothetical protein
VRGAWRSLPSFMGPVGFDKECIASSIGARGIVASPHRILLCEMLRAASTSLVGGRRRRQDRSKDVRDIMFRRRTELVNTEIRLRQRQVLMLA